MGYVIQQCQVQQQCALLMMFARRKTNDQNTRLDEMLGDVLVRGWGGGGGWRLAAGARKATKCEWLRKCKEKCEITCTKIKRKLASKLSESSLLK